MVALGGGVVFAVIGAITVIISAVVNPNYGHVPFGAIVIIVGAIFGVAGSLMGAIVGAVFAQQSGTYRTVVFLICTMGGVIGGSLGAVLAWLDRASVMMPPILVGGSAGFILVLVLFLFFGDKQCNGQRCTIFHQGEPG